MMNAFGMRRTFRIFAVACTITGLLYFLYNKFYLRKRSQVRNHLCSSFQAWESFLRFLMKNNGCSMSVCLTQYSGRFIMFAVITNVYNKKTIGPTLMEFLTATGKLKK